MLLLNTLAEFSRDRCVGICAALVPIDLCLVSATLAGSFLNRSPQLLRSIGLLGIFSAIAICAHVATWLTIGVVMAPTFILAGMAIASAIVQIYAIVYPQLFQNSIAKIANMFIAKYRQLAID